MKSYITGTYVTWKVMSLEHLSHEKYVTGILVTDTLVTRRVMLPEHVTWSVMSLEHLSHEQLSLNICHIYTFSKGNKWFKNFVQLATLMSSAQYHMTPPRLARKQMTVAANKLFWLVFTHALKKTKSQGTAVLVTCSIIVYQHSNMFNNDVCIIHYCAHTIPGNKGQCTVVKIPLSQMVTQENDTWFVPVLHKHT